MFRTFARKSFPELTVVFPKFSLFWNNGHSCVSKIFHTCMSGETTLSMKLISQAAFCCTDAKPKTPKTEILRSKGNNLRTKKISTDRITIVVLRSFFDPSPLSLAEVNLQKRRVTSLWNSLGHVRGIKRVLDRDMSSVTWSISICIC